MAEIERLLPGTMVSQWAARSIAAKLTRLPIDAAYWFGGSMNASRSIVETRFDTDVTSKLVERLSESMNSIGCFANGQTAAYISGNNWGTPVWGRDFIGKFTFPTQSYALLGAKLSEITWGNAGAANSGTAGYYAGGQGRSGSSSVLLDNIEKFLFASDSCSLSPKVLTRTVYYCSAAANSGSTAYWIGGSVSGGGLDNINKTVFGTDVTTMLTGGSTSLSHESEYGVSCANSGTAAYTHIGQTSGVKSQRINKLTFSSETISNLGNLLDTACASMGATAQKGEFAYFVGGNSGSGRLSVIEKLDFDNDTCAALTPTLPDVTSDFAGGSCDAGML